MTWEVDNYNGYPNVAQLNKIFSAIQDIADQGLAGPPGEDGSDGVDGANGWSPVLAIETDLEARYLKVVDWVGGTGTKPTAGLYVASTGLSASIDDAIDIRGPQGEAGVNGEDGADAPSTFVDLTDTPDTLGTDGQVLTVGLDVYANPEIKWADPQGGGGAESLLDLTDTPNTVGVPGQYLGVSPFGTFEYIDPVEPADPVTTEDILPSYTGNTGKLLAVNGAESGVEWVDAPSGGGGGGASVTYGTWTPSIRNASFSFLVPPTGNWWKIGDIFYFDMQMQWTTSHDTNLIILGLPEIPLVQKTALALGFCDRWAPFVGETNDSPLNAYVRNNGWIEVKNHQLQYATTKTNSQYVGVSVSGSFKFQ